MAGVHTFPKGICPKVNVIVRLEFELAYYDSAIERFNRYVTKTSPSYPRRYFIEASSFYAFNFFVSTTIYRLIGQVGRVFANDPGDMGSVPDRVIPKTFKIVLDASLLNTQQYKVRIKGKVEQSKERSRALPNTSM